MTFELQMDGPKDVVIEASLDAIHEANLNFLDGEHYDTLHNVVGITVRDVEVEFRTCRSIEALKRGEPNAGRYTLRIEHKNLQCIYIDNAPVWGKPGFN